MMFKGKPVAAATGMTALVLAQRRKRGIVANVGTAMKGWHYHYSAVDLVELWIGNRLAQGGQDLLTAAHDAKRDARVVYDMIAGLPADYAFRVRWTRGDEGGTFTATTWDEVRDMAAADRLSQFTVTDLAVLATEAPAALAAIIRDEG